MAILLRLVVMSIVSGLYNALKIPIANLNNFIYSKDWCRFCESPQAIIQSVFRDELLIKRTCQSHAKNVDEIEKSRNVKTVH